MLLFRYVRLPFARMIGSCAASLLRENSRLVRIHEPAQAGSSLSGVTTAMYQNQRTCTRTILVLALVLRLGALKGNVGHGIPRVVDTDEQEQNRSSTDDEQCWRRIAWEHHRRDDKCGVGDERKSRMPQPVFQHRLIARLTARPPYNDDDVYHPPETGEAEQKGSIPEHLPWRAE